MFVKDWKYEARNFRKQEIRETTFSTMIIGDEKIFQIQTYGPKGSDCGAKQTIQFDKDRAVQLVDILRREFGI